MYDRTLRGRDRERVLGDPVKMGGFAVIGLAYQRPVVRRIKPLHAFAVGALPSTGHEKRRDCDR